MKRQGDHYFSIDLKRELSRALKGSLCDLMKLRGVAFFITPRFHNGIQLQATLSVRSITLVTRTGFILATFLLALALCKPFFSNAFS